MTEQPKLDNQIVLDYGRPERSRVAANVGIVFAGIAAGAGLVALVGFGAFIPIFNGYDDADSQGKSYRGPPLVAAALFFAAAIAGIVGLLISGRSRKWFLMGFWLGSGIAGLLEGLCFIGMARRSD